MWWLWSKDHLLKESDRSGTSHPGIATLGTFDTPEEHGLGLKAEVQPKSVMAQTISHLLSLQLNGKVFFEREI